MQEDKAVEAALGDTERDAEGEGGHRANADVAEADNMDGGNDGA